MTMLQLAAVAEANPHRWYVVSGDDRVVTIYDSMGVCGYILIG